MKGLFRNNYYSLSNNIQLSFITTLVLAFMPAILNQFDFSLLVQILSIQIIMFTANSSSALATDTNSNWSKFELTMPIKRGDVITARYLTFIALFILGVLMFSLTILISYFAGVYINFHIIYVAFCLGISMALISTGLVYPLLLKFGTERSELLFIICMFISIGVTFVIRFIFTIPDGGWFTASHEIITSTVSLIFSALVFVISYFISLNMYKRKDL